MWQLAQLREPSPLSRVSWKSERPSATAAGVSPSRAHAGANCQASNASRSKMLAALARHGRGSGGSGTPIAVRSRHHAAASGTRCARVSSRRSASSTSRGARSAATVVARRARQSAHSRGAVRAARSASGTSSVSSTASDTAPSCSPRRATGESKSARARTLTRATCCRTASKRSGSVIVFALA
jgi:hypothetical protein